MNKNFKTGILAALLVLPVLLLLFLYKFGDNSYKVPVYHAEDSTKVDGRYVVSEAHTIPSFKLLDQEGKIFTNKNLEGSVYVADFFFSRCKGICPNMSRQLVRVQEEFKNNNTVKIVSFTVDPAYDSAAVLKKYAKDFRADASKWTFLTGSKEAIYKLAGPSGFFLNAKEIPNVTDDFIHDNHFVLVDKKGWIRGYYDGTDKKEVDRLITEITILLKEYGDK